MDDKELETWEYEGDSGETLVHYSMRRIEVDGISSSRGNTDGFLSVHSNTIVGLRWCGDYDPEQDEKGNLYFEWDSPYMYQTGDPIDEEAWLKQGTIVTTSGVYL
jgi:hypothetical protein